MINKITAQVLNERLPLALVMLPPEVIEMLEFKWGERDGLFHSVKATTKKFSKFKDIDIRTWEDRAMTVIDDVLSKIYQCPHCGVDIRKCGVMKRTYGYETVELYISEDGKQARTTHERFDPEGSNEYSCLGCSNRITNSFAMYDFLRRGIRKNVCIEYLHRHHPNIAKKSGKKNKAEGYIDAFGNRIFNAEMPQNERPNGNGGGGVIFNPGNINLNAEQLEELERIRIQENDINRHDEEVFQ